MKLLVHDHGLCSEIAVTLARAGHSVAYHTPAYSQAFPKSFAAKIGFGLEGVERVDNFWQAADRADMVICPDTFSADLVYHLKKIEKPYFGAGEAESLEHDRAEMKQIQKAVGLPVGPYKSITGIEPLIEYLKTHDDKWIKINQFRGDIETFHHDTWSASQAQFLGRMLIDFGANAPFIEFLVEDPIEGIEVGFDGFCIDGEYPMPCLVGYEAKDEGYVGKITDKLPPALEQVNRKLAPMFKRYQSKTIFSTEVRIAKDGKGYLIDPCVRAPHPPLAVELEAFKNFSDLITLKSSSVKIKDGQAYWAALELKSDWVEDHWTEIEFPKQIRHMVKLQQACCIENKYYALPGSFVIATVVGFGSTLKAAIGMCDGLAGTVKCRGLYYNEACLDKLMNETVPEGEKAGVEF